MHKISLCLIALAAACASASGASIRFVVVDQKGQAVKDACVVVRNPGGLVPALEIPSGCALDVDRWCSSPSSQKTVVVRLGQTLTLQQQTKPPVKDIYITVTATRLARPVSETSSGTKRNKEEISKFGGQIGEDVKNVAKTTAGVAEDSAGQLHIRGEHTEISYVVDGVPLPDTLSGRQGAIVVPATIESIDILLGGFAPEYGGQTAAILDIATLPRAKKAETDITTDYGTFNTANGDLTAVGPLGKNFGYALDFEANRTGLADEPQQPFDQSAHNTGSDQNAFGKFTYQASPRDRLALTLSSNPDQMQIGNRTGLPDSFYDAGEGYGFLGLRNRDGTSSVASNGGLGSGIEVLNSQQQDGMDINQREQNEFATLSWRRQIDPRTTSLLGFVVMHSGQDVTNDNPAVD
ncbi:MAG TPA: TonB-dependent receptor plug domain-containing protein, partial [Fimbriimonadaceae bacterium]|nr:TonB-dependent receptor plug domain-containing protein [Fimbriimonadaceae bacterium]